MTFNSKNPTVKLTERSLSNGPAYYISGERELVYSLDIPDTAEYLAIENHSPFWCRPFWGSSLSVLPERVQALLVKHGDTYRYYLPVCDSVFKTLIRDREDGFGFYTYSNCDTVTKCDHQLAFVCMEGQIRLC